MCKHLKKFSCGWHGVQCLRVTKLLEAKTLCEACQVASLNNDIPYHETCSLTPSIYCVYDAPGTA